MAQLPGHKRWPNDIKRDRTRTRTPPLAQAAAPQRDWLLFDEEFPRPLEGGGPWQLHGPPGVTGRHAIVCEDEAGNRLFAATCSLDDGGAFTIDACSALRGRYPQAYALPAVRTQGPLAAAGRPRLRGRPRRERLSRPAPAPAALGGARRARARRDAPGPALVARHPPPSRGPLPTPSRSRATPSTY
jgi:hypothetical protein